MSPLWFLLLVAIRYVVSSKILGFFPYPGISYQMMCQSLWEELTLQGHEVTVITPYPLNDTSLKNLTEIDVSHTRDIFLDKKFIGDFATRKSALSRALLVQHMIMELTEVAIQHESISKLLEYDENHFDLVLVHSAHPLLYFFGAKFKAQIVGVSSFDLFLEFHDAAGNPTHPIISPDVVYNGFDGKLSFMERVKSMLFQFWYRAIYYWHVLPQADRTARKYLGDNIPYLGDVIKNTSIFLVNVNPILHRVRANVPNVIPITQIHIKKEKKPLPKDLQEYLDSASQGVVYLSLGSNVKSANLSTQIRQAIIHAFEEIPYKVLWKWESDFLPDCPENVMTRKWLPQQDLLGHPNIKVFITQGGVQSLEEAIANEVPIIGLPFISDQSANIRRMVDRGAGLGFNPNTITKENLKEAIIEVATNKKFKQKMREAKDILTDDPLKGVDKAVWWMEYVIRHKGAPHLRSEAADMSFFEYFMVDVITFLLMCTLLGLFLFIYCLRVLVRFGRSVFRPTKLKVN